MMNRTSHSSALVDHAARREKPRAALVLLLGLLLAMCDARHALLGWAADAPPLPSSTGGPAVPRLPMIATQGPATRLQGKILRSSRGRKGPVRLLVAREGGGEITVLVAADDYCDRLGLSLRMGEMVDVEGSMLKGERPILIVSSLTKDGKTVRIRDADGKLVDLGQPSPGAAVPPGAEQKSGKATMMGGKPAPTPPH